MAVRIILGQIVLQLWCWFGASGLLFISCGSSAGKDYTAVSCFLSFICFVPFVGGLGYFLHADYTDAENEGLLY